MTAATESTKAVHIHPLIKVERESRALFLRFWETLGLQWNGAVDGNDWM